MTRRAHGRALRALAVALLALLSAPAPAQAARFSDGDGVSWETIRDDSLAFFSNLLLGGADEDGDGEISAAEAANAPTFRAAVLASALLGLTCGLLGCFVTLRRMALFGDMVGHAVLPGVVLGFIVAGTKSVPAMLTGALIAGLLAALVTRFIRGHTRVKEDAALGITLTVFYAAGIWLLSWVASHPDSRLTTQAAGLDRYLFGNPAVIDAADLAALGGAAGLVLLATVLGYKELLVCTFDPSFSTSIGIARTRVDGVLLVLLTLVIVVSIKILGVVLVAAMLTIPPATSYLLTDRFRAYCALSVAIGVGAAFVGVWASFVLRIGQGPAIVCAAFTCLLAAFVASPRHGILSKWLTHRAVALHTVRENIVAAAYRAVEKDPSLGLEIPVARLAGEREESEATVRALARRLRGSGWGRLGDGAVVLTPEGLEHGRDVVRRHRLWELFLSRETGLPPDHVHAGAEEVEHYLAPEDVRELERLLDNPRVDPHGKEIPGAERGGDA